LLPQERHFSSSPNSTLSPYLTGHPALIRYTSTPVYTLSNTGQQKPDGVLISGDFVDGKTAAPARVVNVSPPGTPKKSYRV
jgi:hypothetical protein